MAKRMRKLLVTPHRKSAKHLSQGKSRLSILLDPMCTALADGICVFQGQNLSTRIIFPHHCSSYYMLNLFLPS